MGVLAGKQVQAIREISFTYQLGETTLGGFGGGKGLLLVRVRGR